MSSSRWSPIAAATDSLAEVERLISEPEIPVERRVMYAIKVPMT